ncbi:cupredoxin domain-containing protein [Metabacillus malikii]|uniref:cupredoxin domain-containing protein n=1 Tax=Metabacillus malikii TaxID=1504265 RepID=UPI0027D887DC|nr:cupredoxin domain-containing protein [Metabacillus malikii]
MKLYIIDKKWLVFIVIVLILSSSFLYYYMERSTTTFSETDEVSTLEYHMVTGEFSTTTKDGEKIEAYRFDPGTIIVPKGEKVTLHIFGVNGEEHPFYIEGADIRGIVKKGEETTVPLYFKEEGTYKLICDAHSQNGTKMIAYIVVD